MLELARQKIGVPCVEGYQKDHQLTILLFYPVSHTTSVPKCINSSSIESLYPFNFIHTRIYPR